MRKKPNVLKPQFPQRRIPPAIVVLVLLADITIVCLVVWYAWRLDHPPVNPRSHPPITSEENAE